MWPCKHTGLAWFSWAASIGRQRALHLHGRQGHTTLGARHASGWAGLHMRSSQVQHPTRQARRAERRKSFFDSQQKGMPAWRTAKMTENSGSPARAAQVFLGNVHPLNNNGALAGRHLGGLSLLAGLQVGFSMGTHAQHEESAELRMMVEQ